MKKAAAWNTVTHSIRNRICLTQQAGGSQQQPGAEDQCENDNQEYFYQVGVRRQSWGKFHNK
jgi:hypothetical protein